MAAALLGWFSPRADAASDGALTQLTGLAGCVSETGTGGSCIDGRGLDGAVSIALSPDGNYVYTAAFDGSTVAAFSRNSSTGALTQLSGTGGCVAETGDGVTCADGRGLSGAVSIAVSPDGNHVYVASRNNTLAIFSRNIATGVLTQLSGAAGCISESGDGVTCADAVALVGLRGITVSPDGKSVYVAARDGNSVAIFSRNSGTGMLTQLNGTAGCVSIDGTGGSCVQARGIQGARNVSVSPDNLHVYVAGQDSSAIAVFSRNTGTGALTQLSGTAGCIAETGDGVTCADARGIVGPIRVEVTPDGNHAYVASRDSHSLAIFSRNPATGVLTQLNGPAGCIAETGDGVNCADGKGLSEVVYVTISADGKTVYSAAQVGNAVAAFSRNVSTGQLTQLAGLEGCVSDDGTGGNCTDGNGLIGAISVAVSPDLKHVYVTAYLSDALTVFSREVTPLLSITTTSPLPVGTVNTVYNQTLAATGGTAPYTWTLAPGPLPAGLALSAAGVLSGTPTTQGTSNFTIRVTDNASQTITKAFALTINPQPLLITTASPLPTATAGTAYSQTLVAAQGTPPYTWAVAAGSSLPPGLNMASSGTLSGTPTSIGTFSFTIQVGDVASQTATKAFSLAINPAPPLITTASPLPTATVGTAYSQTLAAAQGTPPYTWAVASGSSLPAGLNIASSGTLSGTPTSIGTFTFTIQVRDGASQTATKAFTLTVSPAALIITTASPLQPGVAGTPYPQQTLAATGGVAPYTWSVAQGSSLPAGLTLSAAGVLSGTPAATGTFNFTVRVNDSFAQPQTAQKQLTLAVSPPSLTITTSAFPIGTVNSAFAQQLQATGGTPPYTWSLFSGTLPAGLTLSVGGVVSGTPTTAGTQNLVIRVTDSAGMTSTRSFSLLVQPADGGSFPAISANLPPVGSPTQQLNLALNLSPASPNPLTIQLKLSFNSNAAIPVDDPMTQFSNGLRSISLLIPANTTSFQVPVILLLGTVSGTAQLAVDIQNGPSNVPVGSITILPAAPHMTSINVVRRSSGFQLQITGYSTARRVVTAEFVFDVRVGTGSQSITLRRSVESDFTTWYQTPGSAAFGSAFLYTQEFTVDGSGVVVSVSIRLINEQGTGSSDPVSISN